MKTVEFTREQAEIIERLSESDPSETVIIESANVDQLEIWMQDADFAKFYRAAKNTAKQQRK